MSFDDCALTGCCRLKTYTSILLLDYRVCLLKCASIQVVVQVCLVIDRGQVLLVDRLLHLRLLLLFKILDRIFKEFLLNGIGMASRLFLIAFLFGSVGLRLDVIGHLRIIEGLVHVWAVFSGVLLEDVVLPMGYLVHSVEVVLVLGDFLGDVVGVLGAHEVERVDVEIDVEGDGVLLFDGVVVGLVDVRLLLGVLVVSEGGHWCFADSLISGFLLDAGLHFLGGN